MASSGWLLGQPEEFRAEVLDRSETRSYAAGQALYHLGDPVGGIHGLLSGALLVTSAPGSALPRVVHVGTPGIWTGEGPFMSGLPRRIGLSAASAARALYLPLEAMEQMVAADPSSARRFGEIPMLSIDLLLRMVHDLLLKSADRRIGAVLLRATGEGAHPLPLAQDTIGDMACATRKQVNFALRRFAAAGWAAHGYRVVEVTDPAALRRFVAAEDEG